MSGKSADCVIMSECVANLGPKMSENIPNVWWLAGMSHHVFGVIMTG